MVLYKRKQVYFSRPPPLPEDLSTEVFIIPETKEWFINYEDYLARLDYYRHRKFVCEITGNSCLTFFEALESETKEIKGVERDFPEALREHILRFLQFNRITRLDQLVDKVYSVFKNDYFPGETIFIKGSISSTTIGQTKQKGTIREKVQYNNPDDDGKSTTKYLVVRLNDMRQAIVTGDKISRDRNHFTKWLIKTFIKLTMSRSHKVGAPWVVKDKYAKKYRIPQVFPEDLKHFEVFTPNGEVEWEEEKKKGRGRRKQEGVDANGSVEDAEDNETVDGEKKPGKGKGKGKGRGRKKETDNDNDNDTKTDVKKKRKSNKTGEDGDLDEDASGDKKGAKKRQRKKKKSGEDGEGTGEGEEVPGSSPAVVPPKKKVLSFPTHYIPENLLPKKEEPGSTAQSSGPNASVSISALQPTLKTIVDDLELKFDLQRKRPTPLKYAPPENAEYWNDLHDDDEDDKMDEDGQADKETDTQLSHVLPIQKALECWAFLNIYHKVLKLDTFTFDDFMYAIGWNHDQFNELGRCELLDEIFCAVLGAIVSNELPKKGSATSGNDSEPNSSISGLLITLPPRSVLESNGKVANEKDNLKKEDEEDNDEERGSDTEMEDNPSQLDKQSDSESDSDKEENSKSNSRKKTDNDEDQDADEEDANEDEEEDEDEDVDMEAENGDDNEGHDHNAYTVMNYRNIPWHDRLRKRNFKDGNWQCIMMGVFSMVEYVPNFLPIIESVYKTLAPIDESLSNTRSGGTTPNTVLRSFYEDLSISMRIHSLNLLISLLAGGKVVRGYIDDCLEVSTGLRRDRLDNIRDYKVSLELIHQYHNQVQSKLEELKKEREKIEAERLEKEKIAAEEQKNDVEDKEKDDEESKDAKEIAKKERYRRIMEIQDHSEDSNQTSESVGVDEPASDKKESEKEPQGKGKGRRGKKKVEEEKPKEDEKKDDKDSKPQIKEPVESKDSKDIVDTKETVVAAKTKFILRKVDLQEQEMTEDEKYIADKDPQFKQLWETKRKELIRMAELKKVKKEIELKLIEMDCQRVKLLGKDRFGNRYWWFENNGLPTLHGGSSEDNEDEEEVEKDADDDDNKDDVLDETYLMGKLWVQGPSNEDVSALLELENENVVKFRAKLQEEEEKAKAEEAKLKRRRKSSPEEIDTFIKTEEDADGFYEEVEKSEEFKEVNFFEIPKAYRKTVEELYGLKYLEKQIVMEEKNANGSLKIETKKANDIRTLLDNDDEVKVEDTKKYNGLLIDHYGAIAPNSPWKSLTPIQRKLIEESDDPLLESAEWRFYDKREDIDKLLSWINPWGSRESQLRKELLVVKDAICSSMDARRKALWIDRVPDSESEVEKQLQETNEKIEAEEKALKESEEKKLLAVGDEGSDAESEVEEVLVLPRGKRRAAAVAAESTLSSRSSKRQKVPLPSTPDQTIATGSLEDLKKLKDKLEEQLEEKKSERELNRILEWVNLGARDEFDRSLYEGGDKMKAKGKNGKTKK